jgi:hypothetical protein
MGSVAGGDGSRAPAARTAVSLVGHRVLGVTAGLDHQLLVMTAPAPVTHDPPAA